MAIFQLVAIGAGLSMDAFAASICRGLGMKRINHFRAFMVALFFGGFQALMPTIGWFLGSRVLHLIEPFDHWVAFGLLAIIGGKMIFDSMKKDEETCDDDKFSYGNLLLMAVATSIDALAVGLTLGMLDTGIGVAALVIGCTTFVFSLAGVYIGYFVGDRFRNVATFIGGIVLILIGLQILLQHLGVIA